MTVSIGCASWSIPGQLAAEFPESGSHLERYSSRFNAVEINTSFYRSHQHKTYVRWAASAPDHFQFAVKVPREITHRKGLLESDAELLAFLSEVSGLGEKLGAILVQLPPSLTFDSASAGAFFRLLRRESNVPVACEPRHPSWFLLKAVQLLEDHDISRVVADPPPVPLASVPAGSRNLCYFRLHGSPEMYHSTYDTSRLLDFARRLVAYQTSDTHAWCIFDNTATGFAWENALKFQELVGQLNNQSAESR